jgi:hypothetical protein
MKGYPQPLLLCSASFVGIWYHIINSSSISTLLWIIGSEIGIDAQVSWCRIPFAVFIIIFRELQARFFHNFKPILADFFQFTDSILVRAHKVFILRLDFLTIFLKVRLRHLHVFFASSYVDGSRMLNHAIIFGSWKLDFGKDVKVLLFFDYLYSNVPIRPYFPLLSSWFIAIFLLFERDKDFGC